MKRLFGVVGCAVIVILMQLFCLGAAAESTELVLVESPYFGYTHSYAMQRAISEFKANNPEYEIVVREYEGDNWKEQLIASLMAGTDQVDILATYDDMYFAYLDHGLLSDLFTYPGFEGITGDWIDIGPLFLREQHLYSVPVYFVDTSFVWNEALARELNVDLPGMDWSWTDFSSLADSVKRMRASSSMDDVFLFAESKVALPLFAWHYTCAYRDELISGTKRYDDEEFRNLLNLWKQLADDELMFLYADMTEVDYAKVLIQDEAFAGTGGDPTYILLPQLGKRSTPVTVIGVGVYAKSKHREKAAEFLQIYASKDNIMAGYPDEGIFLKDISYWDKQPDRVSFTQQRTDYFRHMLNHSVRNDMMGDFEGAVGQSWARFLEGEITDDEFIESLDEAFRRVIDG
ncbi:MAG: ABC transporter substrate-binding protein [Clostridia bacterium]